MSQKPTPLPRKALIKCSEADGYAAEGVELAQEIERLARMGGRYTRTNPQQVEIILDKIIAAAASVRADASTVRMLLMEVKQIGEQRD